MNEQEKNIEEQKKDYMEEMKKPLTKKDLAKKEPVFKIIKNKEDLKNFFDVIRN